MATEIVVLQLIIFGLHHLQVFLVLAQELPILTPQLKMIILPQLSLMLYDADDHAVRWWWCKMMIYRYLFCNTAVTEHWEHNTPSL